MKPIYYGMSFFSAFVVVILLLGVCFSRINNEGVGVVVVQISLGAVNAFISGFWYGKAKEAKC